MNQRRDRQAESKGWSGTAPAWAAIALFGAASSLAGGCGEYGPQGGAGGCAGVCAETCPTTDDGTCDAPSGTGTCAEGTDEADCAAAAECPWTEDGECDEPGGSGLCAEGTDASDCSGDPATTCDEKVDCNDCQVCAMKSECQAEFDACVQDVDCKAYIDCTGLCSSDDCWDICEVTYPEGAALEAMLSACVVCDACYERCDGAASGCPRP